MLKVVKAKKYQLDILSKNQFWHELQSTSIPAILSVLDLPQRTCFNLFRGNFFLNLFLYLVEFGNIAVGGN